VAQKAIESIVSEDRSLTESGRSLVLNCLMCSVSFMDGLINYINNTYRELTMSQYSAKKAWYLVTSLSRRILEDVYEPRIGVLKALRTRKEIQVSTLIYYACLRSHAIMKEYRDLKFANHPSISSEYIKFLAHNSSYEVVENLQDRFKTMEGEIKEFKAKNVALSKSVNTATQKSDETKKGLTDLTKVVNKLENKK